MASVLKKILGARPAAPAGCPRPEYPATSEMVGALCYTRGQNDWYPPLLLPAPALGRRIGDSRYVREALELSRRLEPDDYVSYLQAYYAEGLERFGDAWGYADIVTVLLALAETLRPERYLEIGVRRGRSACAVASKATACRFHLFDLWPGKQYAAMDNPGRALVDAELDKCGHTGPRDYHHGNSHQTLKAFFRDNEALRFDLITVDGDHSREGAIEDLADVLPRLKIGGAIVFDDICHPKHPYLLDVWREMVATDPRFTSWSNSHVGYGVAFALRRW